MKMHFIALSAVRIKPWPSLKISKIPLTISTPLVV